MKLIFIEQHQLRQSKPVFFLKPDTALLRNNQPFFHPDFTYDVRANLSLVLRINRLGKSIGQAFAMRYFDAISVGMDIYAHDLLVQCNEQKLPTDCAKSFDYAAPISSEFIPASQFTSLSDIRLQLFLNDNEIKTETTLFYHTPAEIILHISQFLTLKIGDYIYINTPLSTGTLKIGDTVTALLDGKEMIKVEIK